MLGCNRFRAIDERCWNAERRIADMNAEGVVCQVVSPIPATFCYHLDARGTYELAEAQNEWIAELVRSHRNHFVGLGTVPMQDAGLAASMVENLVGSYGLKGIEIGSNVAGRGLDEPALAEFFYACEEFDAIVFIHPWQVLGADRLGRYGLLYSVGMPAETAAAAAMLIVGGVLDRHPQLKIVLAHGGGALLAMVPRIQRFADTLPGVTPPLKPLTEYLRRFFYDSLVYDAATLDRLALAVGADRLMIGTDYPFPVAERPAGSSLDESQLTGEEKRAIYAETAADLFAVGR